MPTARGAQESAPYIEFSNKTRLNRLFQFTCL
jgi:hypothetical protein